MVSGTNATVQRNERTQNIAKNAYAPYPVMWTSGGVMSP